MQLLMSPASPFVRKVRVTAREAGIALEETEVSTTPLASAPQLVAANPLGKIPALVRNDGPTLFDSRVICRFLDDQGKGGLYPEARIWDVLTLEALGDGISDAAVAMAYEKRLRDADKVSDDWIEAQWAKIARALDALEASWMPLLGGPVTAGQIAVGCALGYIDLRHDSRGWRDGHATLAAWFAKFETRSAMEQTRPT